MDKKKVSRKKLDKALFKKVEAAEKLEQKVAQKAQEKLRRRLKKMGKNWLKSDLSSPDELKNSVHQSKKQLHYKKYDKSSSKKTLTADHNIHKKEKLQLSKKLKHQHKKSFPKLDSKKGDTTVLKHAAPYTKLGRTPEDRRKYKQMRLRFKREADPSATATKGALYPKYHLRSTRRYLPNKKVRKYSEEDEDNWTRRKAAIPDIPSLEEEQLQEVTPSVEEILPDLANLFQEDNSIGQEEQEFQNPEDELEGNSIDGAGLSADEILQISSALDQQAQAEGNHEYVTPSLEEIAPALPELIQTYERLNKIENTSEPEKLEEILPAVAHLLQETETNGNALDEEFSTQNIDDILPVIGGLLTQEQQSETSSDASASSILPPSADSTSLPPVEATSGASSVAVGPQETSEQPSPNFSENEIVESSTEVVFDPSSIEADEHQMIESTQTESPDLADFTTSNQETEASNLQNFETPQSTVIEVEATIPEEEVVDSTESSEIISGTDISDEILTDVSAAAETSDEETPQEETERQETEAVAPVTEAVEFTTSVEITTQQPVETNSESEQEELETEIEELGPETDTSSEEETRWPWEMNENGQNSCGQARFGPDKRRPSTPMRQLKILLGKEALPGAFPWQVALFDQDKDFLCGGTLIAPRWVMTAAHCVRKRLYVRLSEHHIGEKDGLEIEQKVLRIYRHPDYNRTTIDNDIALLRLPRLPAYRDEVTGERTRGVTDRACLPSSSEEFPAVGTRCMVMGWGKTSTNHGFGTQVLMYTKLPIISRKACINANRKTITENMFCAGHYKGGSDTCSGDSGGPLLCTDGTKDAGETWTVHGVTSFGDGCGVAGQMGVYAKVNNYLDWMASIMNRYI